MVAVVSISAGNLTAAAGGRLLWCGVIPSDSLDQAQLVDQMHDHIRATCFGEQAVRLITKQHGYCQCQVSLRESFISQTSAGVIAKNTQPIIPQFSYVQAFHAAFTHLFSAAIPWAIPA